MERLDWYELLSKFIRMISITVKALWTPLRDVVCGVNWTSASQLLCVCCMSYARCQPTFGICYAYVQSDSVYRLSLLSELLYGARSGLSVRAARGNKLDAMYRQLSITSLQNFRAPHHSPSLLDPHYNKHHTNEFRYDSLDFYYLISKVHTQHFEGRFRHNLAQDTAKTL